MSIIKTKIKSFDAETFSDVYVDAVKITMTLDDSSTIERTYKTDAIKFDTDRAAFSFASLL
ncbi:hypothetical protein J7J47_03650 [Halomonas sp. ISL-60]|uniref:hypothetical protein n=1 Tax=Halomonas sp. ISL-56 TaxID=2819149 RepID=UPI001BE87A72|nr:hypothetical protein [Halomonas sp. ISL-56]MBT2771324.1 hypothetical protein [Halomonas sp. ISL-60]MBT2800681.1 hypothetical protein [Halomonas sp. ISL-56]